MVTSFKIHPEITPRVISLQGNPIQDKGWIILSEVIINNDNNLQILGLDHISMGPRGLRSVATALASRNSSLVWFITISNSDVGDAGSVAVVEVFSSNPRLLPDKLCFDLIDGVVSTGLRVSFPPIESMQLMCNDVWDHNLVVFLGPFQENPSGTPKKLDLSGNEIGRSGCVEILELLKSSHCTIGELGLNYLNGSLDMDDYMAYIFAGALASNATLSEFEIDTSQITRVGWDYLESVICEKTSIMATFTSNHTLVEFVSPYDDLYIRKSFSLNEIKTKRWWRVSK